jgi:hypothetical protein
MGLIVPSSNRSDCVQNSDGCITMFFLFLHSGRGSGTALVGAVWQVPHGLQKTAHLRKLHLDDPHPRQVADKGP